MDRINEIPAVNGLEFDDLNHIYTLDGIVLPSVTHIINPLSMVKYDGISERTLDNAASKGTSVHNAIENWIKFGIEDIPTEYSGYFNAFRSWWDKNQPVVVGSEVRICHSLLRYAGTADLVCYIGDDLTLVDFKSTYAVSDMTCGVQLEGYNQALRSMGVNVDKKKILHLKKNGKHKEKNYPLNDADRWRVFGSLKIVYDYIEQSKN